MTRTTNVFTALLIAAFAAACESPTPAAADSRVQPEYDKTGRLMRLSFDRDGDGKVETWGYMDGARVERVEIDENADGTVDRWEYHGQGAQGAQGAHGAPGAPGAPGTPDRTIERIDRATRHDGRVSRREFFENGTLTRVEEDTDGDGVLDKWETYSGGTLLLMALDSSGRGRPDRRLVYKPNGSLDHVEADLNGSGTFKPITTP